MDQAYKSGILIIAAAGNEGYSNEGSITYPARYKSVIAVGSINENELRDYNSSVGQELELVAPGVGIYSTLVNVYGYNTGTSMAAPHVAGVAALYLEENPQLNNKKGKKLLNTTAKPLGDP